MTNLTELLAKRQAVLQAKLEAGAAFYHPTAKGDASELNWIGMLDDFLPNRYQVSRGSFVIDSDEAASSEIDIVIHDNVFHPKLFEEGTRKFIPAESVYGVFESKQELGPSELKQAQDKAAEVRRMKRTSEPIKHAGGVYPKIVPGRILSGIFADRGHWQDPFGTAFRDCLDGTSPEQQLDLGLVTQVGSFHARYLGAGGLADVETCDPDTALMFMLSRLYAELLGIGSVPALNIFAYDSEFREDS